MNQRFAVHQTPAEACALHPSGWAKITPTIGAPLVLVTKLPLIDTRPDASTFARPTARTSLVVAAALGAYLMSTGLVDLITRDGFYLNPVIVRETDDEIAERKARGGTDPLERMATVEWARRHDDAILRQLPPWSGESPVCNAGKDWIGGAKPGRALNYGLDRDPDPNVIRYWQTLGTRHDDAHTDYSQTLRLWKPYHPSTLDACLEIIDSMVPSLTAVARVAGFSIDEISEVWEPRR